MDKAAAARITAGKYAEKIEKGICYSALTLMALLPFADVLLRPFNIVIPFSRAFLIHLFLVMGLFAAMLTTRAKEHISIVLIQFAKSGKVKTLVSEITSLISAFIATILFWDSISFIKFSLPGRASGIIPGWLFALAMPVAYGVIALRFATNIRFDYSAAAPKPEEKEKRNWFRILWEQRLFKRYLPLSGKQLFLPVLVLLLGTAAAFPAVAKIVWGFEPPGVFYDLVNRLYDLAVYAKTPIIIFLIIAALSGTSIFAAIGGIALVMLQAAGSEPDAVPIQIYSALTDADIIAIPLFTVTGFFLSESRAGERLVTAFRSLFSWIPGGMIIATVIICAFFTSFTGASGITILALGGILYTILSEKSGYPAKFSIGLLTSVGCIGLLFPPSLPIILVGSTTNSILYFMGETVPYSIIDFFLGGIIPGIILVLAMISFGIIASIKIKIPVEPFNIKDACAALKGSVLEILLPVILIAGYFSGILSLVEVSAVSAIYVFVAEVLIHHDIALKDLSKVFSKAVPIIGGVLAILAVAKALSYAIIDTQVPEQFVHWMQGAVESKYLFLLLLNLALLFLGCVMDIFSAILVVLPLIVPLGQAYGVDPVHLGIIFIVNLEMGFLTPPVGLNLFLASYRFKKPFMQICKYVLPFLAVQLTVVLLVTYVPWFSSFLVKLLN